MPKIPGWTRTFAKSATGGKNGGTLGRTPDGKYGVFLRWKHDTEDKRIEIVYDSDSDSPYEVHASGSEFPIEEVNSFDTKSDAQEQAKRLMNQYS